MSSHEHLLWTNLAHNQFHKIVICDGQGQFWLVIILRASFIHFPFAFSEVQTPLAVIYIEDHKPLRSH